MNRFFYFVFCIIFCSTIARADQPLRFNYQGKITDGSGGPLTGNHTCYFTLYEGGTAASANSGTVVFSESASLNITNGIVNHVVGTGTQVSPSGLTDAIFQTNLDLFLQVAVSAPTNIILPRARLESVPFAITARTATTAASASNGFTPGALTISATTAPLSGFTDTGLILTNHWARRAPYSESRFQSAAAAVGGNVYFVGGSAASVTGLNEQYNPLTDVWTTRAPLSPARYGLTLTELNGSLYAIGGFTSGPTYYGDVDMYNPAANSWAPRQDITIPRSSHITAAVNGRLYVVSGESALFNNTTTVEEYDPGTNSWTPKSSIPVGRSGAAGAALNGKIYVVGGSDGFALHANNQVYDVASNTWSTAAPFPIPIHYAEAVGVAGKLYVIGGYIDGGQPTSATWIFDPATDTWTIGPPLLQPRLAHTVAALDNKIYVMGGGDFIATEILTPESLNAGIFYLFQKN